MKKMIVVGIDYSLTSPCVCIARDKTFSNSFFYFLNDRNLADFKKEEVIVLIEDYSFGSKGKVFNLAENCGILKYMLYKAEYKFFTVPPTVVKKYATGKGNATKEKMYEAFLNETFIDLHNIISPTTKLGSPTTDIVDAWYIARYMIDKHTEKEIV